MFTLIGHVGVALMIFESGMHFDFQKAKEVGPWACLIAVLGTLLPLVGGTGLAMAFGSPLFPNAIVAGTALAPTSVGISLKLLTEAKMLDKNFGQTIMTAAFVDDILSLILFNIIFSIGAGSVTFMHTFFPAIMGVFFMVVAVMLAIFLWPWLLKDVMAPYVRKFAKEKKKIPIEDEAIVAIMLMVLASYSVVTFFCGTHLWGCFIAGMSFACLGHDVFNAHELWERQTKRITAWMLRIFFACTVAFSIPLAELLSFEAFWKGTLMGIGPCIATKVFCAFFMGKSRWVIGWGMVGRAEFAYLIAQMGLAGGMLDKELFSIVIWALLWATVCAPFFFGSVLHRFVRDNAADLDHNAGNDSAAHDQEQGVQLDIVNTDMFPASSRSPARKAVPAADDRQSVGELPNLPLTSPTALAKEGKQYGPSTSHDQMLSV
jgi:Kef-type K+ transport system membrane component KefB